MSVVIPSLRAAVAVPGWAKNELWRKARAVPSPDLRFADNKSLTDAVTGASLVTFTRASDGTVTDSAGVLQTAATDVPRFDHNPITGESLGLLVEEQRTNLLLRSEEFDDAYWTKTRATVSANDVASPSGTISADKLVEDATASDTHFISRSIALGGTVDSSTYSISVYVKAAERSQIRMVDDGQSTSGATIFDLTAGTASGTGTISNAGSGWYRCTIYPKKDFGTTSTFQIYLVSTGSTFTYTGDGTSGVYLWGAQLEAGAFPTSYIGPTTTAAVTRSADVASITGSAFSSWYRQDEGSLFADYTLAAGGAVSNAVFSINDNTGDNRILLRPGSLGGGVTFFVIAGDVNYAALNVTGGSVTSVKAIIAYRTDDIAATRNGGALELDASATIPTVTRIDMGADVSNSTILNGTIRRLTFWGQRLPDNVLQSITQ
jgi:hypothetical protein